MKSSDIQEQVDYILDKIQILKFPKNAYDQSKGREKSIENTQAKFF